VKTTDFVTVHCKVHILLFKIFTRDY